MTNPLSLLIGWLLDLIFGDPQRLPHPVVWFGRMIAFGERRLNLMRGERREVRGERQEVRGERDVHRQNRLMGGLMAVGLILFVFGITCFIRYGLFMLQQTTTDFFGISLSLSESVSVRCCPLLILFDAICIFYCLAGTTLIREVRQVFLALDRSLEEGRAQVARIVGRDTSQLSAQEVRKAALETLAENLSDGVIAPLFWLALLGTPGMMAYKMVNTLDSMIGYKTERYKNFGCWAAHIDDVANYIPARLTALLMAVANFSLSTFHFSLKYGRNHASPNSGYPEAALAGILNCRFGGPHYYFGELFDKPYIGTNDRPLTTADMKKAVRINRTAEILAVILTTASIQILVYFI